MGEDYSRALCADQEGRLPRLEGKFELSLGIRRRRPRRVALCQEAARRGEDDYHADRVPKYGHDAPHLSVQY